jgi:hypothetical protein
MYSTAALASGVMLSRFGGFVQRLSAGPSDPPLQFDRQEFLRTSLDETTGLPLLKLPEGFRYRSFGWTGEVLDDGTATPADHDGMAVLSVEGDCVILCRNHEVGGSGPAIGRTQNAYDRFGRGGCVNLVFDLKREKVVESWCSLAGTVKNCAGGPTPWGTWLSCEETTVEDGSIDKGMHLTYEQTHGWVFEVPARGSATARPITALGRFVHEAVAIDTETGFFYQTEDRSESGLYRYCPTDPQRPLAGGTLEMLAVKGGARDLRKGLSVGSRWETHWVPIDEPMRAHADERKRGDGVFRQGYVQGGATFAGLEGCWYTQGKVFFTAKSGGSSEDGQIWRYDPRHEELVLVYESESGLILDMPDNVTSGPGKGLLICEDGETAPMQRLQCLSEAGVLTVFAENNVDLTKSPYRGFNKDYRKSEWAGATFSPCGKWLFVNIQTPGLSLAITGPWESVL